MIKTALLMMLQLGCCLALAPLVHMVLKKLKAFLQGRQGPPWLQGYYDLFKYFRKETVVSDQTSWLFLATPGIVFGCVCVAALLVPSFLSVTASQSLGDMIVLVYLLGLARFFTVSAAMEPGSGFCGMAGSREIMLASLIEPVLLLSLFVISLIAGSTNLFNIVGTLSQAQLACLSPAYLLAVIALFVACIAEMGRIPFDNPETHYELTMIHEGMLLEYSGKPLGLMFWAGWTKQLVVLSLVANLMFPWGIDAINGLPDIAQNLLAYFIKLLALCVIIALIETVVAKMRLFRVKDALGAAFVFGLLALILTAYTGGVLLP